MASQPIKIRRMTAEIICVFRCKQLRDSVEKSILPTNYVRRSRVVTHRLDRRETHIWIITGPLHLRMLICVRLLMVVNAKFP